MNDKRPTPPFRPDPEIVGHLEGDRRQIERYGRACEEAIKRADSEQAR